MRFQENVWFFDSSNAARLQFHGDNTYLQTGSSGGKHIFRNSSGSERFEIDASGNAIADGNITAYGAASDIRLKENIERIEQPIEKVKKLDGVTFNYKKDGSRSTGLIAQQLLEVLPEVVYETSDLESDEQHYAVRYGQVVGLLVESIKAQQEQIEELQQTIEEMKNGNH